MSVDLRDVDRVVDIQVFQRWNKNSGISAYAPTVTSVIDVMPEIRGFTSPRYMSPVPRSAK
jgi:hypothetical protein